MAFRFESLDIWHMAREFAALTYDMTAKFPAAEVHSLAAQMNRAANAVALCIAEGSGLDGNALFAQRLSQAVGETFRAVSGSYLALDRAYLTSEQQARLYGAAEKLSRKINAFRNTLR